ncbi:TMEM62 [Cordylochernes scorpioides]|uniref:TMEM62 n=1 Tax=Cordylochernes scorpioides TaxID=51811 RepID=A0ABY6LUW7_9ARAC|nr:TMEM62 [Cordylochernes scorpioides]
MKNNPNKYNITHPPSFIQEIAQIQPPAQHTMFSFDVTSLYLSLPHTLITDTLQSFLRTANIDKQVIAQITQLTTLCLSISTFTFNHQYYKQIRGTPMGSPLSSIVSEVVMGSLDRWINQTLPSDIHYWRRYVDDIFCIAKTNKLRHILDTLHTFHADIKFTHESEIDLVLPFLDILVIRTPHKLHTTVFHKKTIPPLYTHFSSNSPIAYKINTVRTLTKRIYTHCSLPIFKTIEKSRIISLLTSAGYPRYFIDKHSFDPVAPKSTTVYRATCLLPFSPDSIAISRILRPYGVRVFYNSPPSIATLLRNPITKADKPHNPIHSTGAVYAVSCQDCPASYVGETGRTARQRKRNVRALRHYDDCPSQPYTDKSDYSGVGSGQLRRFGQRVNHGLTFEHHTGPQQGVMIWCAISFKRKTPLIVIPGILTAQGGGLLKTMRLSLALREKRLQYANRQDKVIFQHDNARPHAATLVKTYLETLKWEVLPHPPYSPDIDPSDYYLFGSMQRGLADQHFNYDEVKNESMNK